MALIKCPECGKEISDKARSCPNCGCPIAEERTPAVANADKTEIENVVETPPFPELPTVMNVGKQIVNWGFDAALDGCYFMDEENYTHYIKESKVSVMAHTNGICVQRGIEPFYLSHTQIISMKFVKHEQLFNQKKSVVGRALVGGLILGPLGAVVGGLSGVGSKTKNVGNYLFVINFWDVYTHSVQSLLLSSQTDSPKFIERVESEKANNKIPEGNNYVCNILDDNGEISDDKAIAALKIVGETKLAEQIALIENIGTASALAKVRKIGQSKSIDTQQYQSAGCSVALLIMGTLGAALGSLLLCACS